MGDPSEERPAALLTKAQREYLRGEKDYAPSTERDIRSRIRDRVRDGLADLELLVEYLPDEELEEAIRPEGEAGPRLWQLIGFLYAAGPKLPSQMEDLVNTDFPARKEQKPLDEWLEQIIKMGIQQGARRRDGVTVGRIDVDVQIVGAEDGKDQSEYTFDELGFLVQEGQISREEFIELASKHFPSDEDTPYDRAESRAEWVGKTSGYITDNNTDEE
jgi:hypothetical protein